MLIYLFDTYQKLSKSECLMGCKKTILRKNDFTKSFPIIFFCFTLFFSISSQASSYIPSAPEGPYEGDIGVEYEFKVYTSESAASWKFDWDDGNYSDWVSLEDSLDYVSQNYSWDKEGEYSIRVKHKAKYIGESDWSSSLKITILESFDIDEDGWNNTIEISYGTNITDENDYPLDTDNDGIPDEGSLDNSYTGDFDDDNDLLDDAIELIIGSDPLDKSDVTNVKINDETHFLVDVNNDGEIDFFYNSNTKNSSIVIKLDNNILIDMNDDGFSDYAYDIYIGIVQKYVPSHDIVDKGRTSEFPWTSLIITVGFIVVLIIFLLFRKGVFYVYEEEYEVDDKEQ